MATVPTQVRIDEELKRQNEEMKSIIDEWEIEITNLKLQVNEIDQLRRKLKVSQENEKELQKTTNKQRMQIL